MGRAEARPDARPDPRAFLPARGRPEARILKPGPARSPTYLSPILGKSPRAEFEVTKYFGIGLNYVKLFDTEVFYYILPKMEQYFCPFVLE